MPIKPRDTYVTAQSQSLGINEKPQKAFFGRRKGRPLGQKQNDLFYQYLPLLHVNLDRPAPADLTQLFTEPENFRRPVENVRLEIGFGGGEHLLHEATYYPDTGFIGIEPFMNGMAKMLALMANTPQKFSNIRLYHNDAIHVLNWLPEHSLSGIDIFYPDPWPKKKHWKRRFFNAENLRHFARVLKKGGILRFASDIDSYTNQVLQLISGQTGFLWQAESADDWQKPYQNWPSTRYEVKAQRAGRHTAYLTFIRQ